MKHVLRNGLMVLGLVIGSVTSATAQVSVGVWLPGVSIGINLPVYPQLVAVPGYPVYYAPQMNSNYFFYDGMYWVYQSDNWYASSWYNGPWGRIGPEAVPVYLLRVPVRYYRAPPPYFRGWQADRPPRWDQHWGNEWNQRRSGWDQWDHRSAPQRAPLPTYQRQYSGNKYPQHVEQQAALQGQKYQYQPRDAEVRQHYESQRQQAQGAPGGRRADRPRTPATGQQRRAAPAAATAAAAAAAAAGTEATGAGPRIPGQGSRVARQRATEPGGPATLPVKGSPRTAGRVNRAAATTGSDSRVTPLSDAGRPSQCDDCAVNSRATRLPAHSRERGCHLDERVDDRQGGMDHPPTRVLGADVAHRHRELASCNRPSPMASTESAHGANTQGHSRP